MANHSDNQNLSFLPHPGEGRFWEVKYSNKVRTKPLILRLRESFRAGSPIGELIGEDFAEANEKSLVDVAHNVLVRTADRKKYTGTYGVQAQEG